MVSALGAAARAQPAGEPNTGFIGKGPVIPRLEIEDCPQVDPGLDNTQRIARGRERYERGETLYIQGDYEGAVRELIGSYCLIQYYGILKDIGQAYERKLDYERAIGYLSKYIERIPPNATRPTPCAADPQEDRENVSRRIHVLTNLTAQVFVQTNVTGARITIENDGGVASRGESGDTLSVQAGTYDMVIKHNDHETISQKVTLQIGKPYTFYFSMTPLKGTLAVQASPDGARIFLDDQLVGIGRIEKLLPPKRYKLDIELKDHTTYHGEATVLQQRTTRMPIELQPEPLFGRRQLIAYSTVGAGFATGALLFAFNDNNLVGAGSLIGAAAGFVGSYFYLPDGLELGTSNLTITTSLATAIGGAAMASLFTDDDAIRQPVIGASLIAGAGAGYYLARRLRVSPGDAAVVNSAILWGTAAGAGFAVSFAPPREVTAGLVLSGLGMGAISGVLLTRYFDVSRTRAVLIDVGGLAGVIGGLAVESLVNPSTTTAGNPNERADREREHLANYALAGMAVGLVVAGVLTRNFDTPDIPVRATVGAATDAAGRSTTTYGLSATW
ncbi:MAG: PEGA domain-containing protein [Deltaproteobacteria bacterium]|nr:PEGA domain-containing protein [Deltaproteobacteria bacterium]